VNFDTALMAIPLEGLKRARTTSGVVKARVGSIFLVPSPISLDVENVPERAGACYMSIAIPFEPHVIEAARQLLRDPVTDVKQEPLAVSIDDHISDLTMWLDSLEASNFPRACHALVGIVLRLYSQGKHHGLMYAAPPTLCARIRAMVAASPAREWASAEIEAHLGMSGASLRRHLAAEGMGLREIIAEARLSHALKLLTSTQLSVKAVAQKVGYTSASAFSRRFSERFGVDPSEVNTG
jgi:AraC-like DNA-binding protein